MLTSETAQTKDTVQRVVDACILLAICVAPFLLGGRYAVGRLAFVSLAAVAAIAYAVKLVHAPTLRWRYSPAQWLFLAAALVILIQLIPLPDSAIRFAHPSQGDHLPLWTGSSDADSALGVWNRVSYYPHATLAGLAMLCAYAAVFLVAFQSMNTLESVERWIRWVAVAAIAMGVVGLLQYLVGNGKFLWIYEHPFRMANRSPTGAFDNNNHFAHFMALGCGPLVWWLVGNLQSTDRKHRRSNWHNRSDGGRWRSSWLAGPYLPLLGLGLVVFAGLLSTSRGGALVILLALAASVAVLYRSGNISGRIAAGLATVCVIAGAALGVHGLDRVSEGLDDLVAGSVDELDREGMRRAVWAANLAAFSDHWALGGGVGTHRFLIPIYLEQSYPTEFSHAESGYLQVLTETGIPGAILLAGALALCGRWCWRSVRFATSSRHLAAAAAVVGGLVASVVHSIWDFPWYIPALMTVTCLLAACICRLSSLTCTRSSAPAGHPGTSSLHFRWAGLALTTLAGFWAVATWIGPALASPHWDSYLRRSLAFQAEKGSLRVDSEISAGEQHARDVLRTDAMIADLQSALHHDPNNARIHLRLAGKLLARYDLALPDAPNEMPLNQLRDAAAVGGFSHIKELHAWVERAVGREAKSYLDRAVRHIHLAHEATPLEGEGYLHLADLGFLEGASPELAAALLDQARRVDPHDGDVLIRAASDAFLRQDFDTATKLWQAAFATGPEYQRKMVQLMASRVPVGFFLESFQPDLSLLDLMEYRYNQMGLPQELQTLRKYAATRTVAAAQKAQQQASPEAGELWLRALVFYRKLEEFPAAAACGKRAVALNPQDFNTRHTVGRILSQVGEFAEAERHLTWCRDRQPDNARLRTELQQAVEGRLRSASAERIDAHRE